MQTKRELITEAQEYLRDYIWDNWMHKKNSSVELNYKNDLIKISIKDNEQEIEGYLMFITRGMNDENEINVAISIARNTNDIQHHFTNVLQKFEYTNRHNLVMKIDSALEKYLYLHLKDVEFSLSH
jgi:hypothetical protein